MIEKVMEIGLQSKYSGPSPTFVDCQKDSQTTVGNGTHVKPVLLAVKVFAVCRDRRLVKKFCLLALLLTT